jgi:methylmalonyl-CoA mutase, C-terminal domain
MFMNDRQRIKVLVSVIGLDGHFTGAEIVSRFLMDAGMEVVYLGIYQTPEMIVSAAIQESVDVIGISSHASNYEQINLLMDLMKKNNLSHIPVVCGGTIPKQYAEALIKKGVAKIFPPQSTSDSIVDYIVSSVKRESIAGD